MRSLLFIQVGPAVPLVGDVFLLDSNYITVRSRRDTEASLLWLTPRRRSSLGHRTACLHDVFLLPRKEVKRIPVHFPYFPKKKTKPRAEIPRDLAFHKDGSWHLTLLASVLTGRHLHEFLKQAV